MDNTSQTPSSRSGVGRGRPLPRSNTEDPTPNSGDSQPQLQALLEQQAAIQQQLAVVELQLTPQSDRDDTASGHTHTSATQGQGDIAAVTVTVKLPPYWAADPQVWFAQIESLFATRRITSQLTMFHHVIGSLSPEYAAEVRDLILRPPSTVPFDTLKAALIKRTKCQNRSACNDSSHLRTWGTGLRPRCCGTCNSYSDLTTWMNRYFVHCLNSASHHRCGWF